MPQPFPNGWQAHSTIDEFSRVCMPKLVERAGDSRLRAIVAPSFLHRLVAKRSRSSRFGDIPEIMVILAGILDNWKW